MQSKIKIRRGVPLPPDGRRSKGYSERPYEGRSPYPFPKMREGDSFVITLRGRGNTAEAVRNRLSVGCVNWGRKLGAVFTLRSLKGQIGVWRIR